MKQCCCTNTVEFHRIVSHEISAFSNEATGSWDYTCRYLTEALLNICQTHLSLCSCRRIQKCRSVTPYLSGDGIYKNTLDNRVAHLIEFFFSMQRGRSHSTTSSSRGRQDGSLTTAPSHTRRIRSACYFKIYRVSAAHLGDEFFFFSFTLRSSRPLRWWEVTQWKASTSSHRCLKHLLTAHVIFPGGRGVKKKIKQVLMERMLTGIVDSWSAVLVFNSPPQRSRFTFHRFTGV